MDALFGRKAATIEAMRTNVHVRNPAQKLFERKGFRVVGQGAAFGYSDVQKFAIIRVIGGVASSSINWDTYDRVMAEQRRIVALVSPTRVHRNG